MPNQDSLYIDVHSRFREAFGQPHAMLGGAQQWSLKTNQLYDVPIHVLLNGTANAPGVWVFDPHDHKTGIQSTPIMEQRQIGELINLIQGRLDLANNKNRPAQPGTPPPPAEQ